MSESLEQLVETVAEEASVLVFLAALAADRAEDVRLNELNPASTWGPGPLGWENGTIEAFLDGAEAWGTATAKGLEHYQPSTNPWRRCAEILLMGKQYE